MKLEFDTGFTFKLNSKIRSCANPNTKFYPIPFNKEGIEVVKKLIEITN
jgi:hypothetical protein